MGYFVVSSNVLTIPPRKVFAHRVRGGMLSCYETRFRPQDLDLLQNGSVGLKTSFPKLVHDFDWKSIPATRKQKQGFRDLRSRIWARTSDSGNLAQIFAHRVRIHLSTPPSRFLRLSTSPVTTMSNNFPIIELNLNSSSPPLSPTFSTFSFAYFGRGPLHRFFTLET